MDGEIQNQENQNLFCQILSKEITNWNNKKTNLLICIFVFNCSFFLKFKQKFLWGFSYGFLPIFEIQLTKSRKTNFTHFPFLWRSYGFSFFPFPFLVVANVNVPNKSVLILELENLPLYLTYYIMFNFLISFFSCLNALFFSGETSLQGSKRC